ncbi:MFS transporter [Nocardioides sp.]|uniref:MFS transporter n=1 Tax=Nocardioides sp. TaxID=35761 RepID=UPI002D070C5D|nr:MFS transporter [Nocardioides sp.]HXH79916.1 MFS transporter [Nocardioides sp.]
MIQEPGDGGSIRENRNFLRYWFGHAVSAFGDQISALALPLIAATTLQASATQVALLTAAIWTPNLVSLFVGTWADRHPRPRALLIAANLAQALAVGAVPCAWLIDALSMPLLYAAGLALGAGGVVYDTSYPRFFAHLVPRRDYVAANSMLSTTNSVAGIAGPAAGGALVQAITAPVAMIIDAASFLISAVVIRSVHETRTSGNLGEQSDQPEHYLRRLVGGIRYLIAHPHLRASLGVSTVMNFAAFVVQGLLVFYAARELQLSAGQIGLAFTLGASGGLLGALAAPQVSRRLGIGPTIALGATLYCLPFIALAFASTGSRAVILIASVEAVSALGVMLFDINNNAMRTAVTRDEMRSRVAGAYSTVNYGIRPLGAICGGVLADQIGLRPTFFLAGLGGLLAASIVGLSPIMRLRSINDIDHID